MQPLVFPLGPTHQILVDASEERIQPGLVEAPVVVDPALHDRLMNRARSARVLSLRRLSRQRRISRPIAFLASSLTAGRKLTKNFPCLLLASRGRNVYPKKSNRSCSCEPRRFASLQYTMRVLSGCSSRPTLRQPFGDGAQDHLGLRLSSRSARPRHRIPLERDRRELPGHPRDRTRNARRGWPTTVRSLSLAGCRDLVAPGAILPAAAARSATAPRRAGSTARRCASATARARARGRAMSKKDSDVEIDHPVLLQHRSRQTPTASSADRPGR